VTTGLLERDDVLALIDGLVARAGDGAGGRDPAAGGGASAGG
jgi:hypothetical protein